MTPLIDIAIAAVGTTSTLALFGGKATVDGSEPILKRITPRGRISLACLALSFLLGVTKYVDTDQEARDKARVAKADRDKDAAEADARQAVLKAQLAEANSKADAANLKLEALQGIDKTNLSRLDEAKTNLADVRSNLTSTRKDLNEQTQASLIAVFAHSNLKIREIDLFIPMLAGAPVPERAAEVTLPHFSNKECEDRIEARLIITLPPDHVAELGYDETGAFPTDTDEESSGIDATDEVTQIDPKLYQTTGGIQRVLGVPSTNGWLYTAKLKFAGRGPSPAALYGSIERSHDDAKVLSRFGTGPVALTISWRLARNDGDEERLAHKMLDRLQESDTSKYWDYDWDDDKEQIIEAMRRENQRSFPSGCSAELKKHFERTFGGAVLAAQLDSDQKETILFRLQALPLRKVNAMWNLVYVSAGNAIVDLLPGSLTNEKPEDDDHAAPH